jgi:hypothetical protein
LAGEDNLTFVTGGFRHWANEPERGSADWSTAEAAFQRLKAGGVRAEERFETLLPEPDSEKIVRFRVGKVRTLYNRTRQARRFALVNSVDVLVTVEGDENTREMIDLALALEKPTLPLPFTGEISRERWQANRGWIQECFALDEATAESLERVLLSDLSEDRLSELVGTIATLILGRLTRKCFIIMPFSSAYLPLYEKSILPAISDEGFTPIRADRLNLVGDAVGTLRRAITNCDCALAVITPQFRDDVLKNDGRYNPNVMYELGFAHALGKPVILLCEYLRDGELPELPFDLRTEYMVGYGQDREALRAAIGVILRQFQHR